MSRDLWDRRVATSNHLVTFQSAGRDSIDNFPGPSFFAKVSKDAGMVDTTSYLSHGVGIVLPMSIGGNITSTWLLAECLWSSNGVPQGGHPSTGGIPNASLLRVFEDSCPPQVLCTLSLAKLKSRVQGSQTGEGGVTDF